MKKKPKSEQEPPAAGELPEAELDVMACLWKMGQGTAREIREAMETYRPMTQGAMVTLLSRLEGKGWVQREKSGQGKAFLYKPARQPAPTYKRLMQRMLHRVFGGDGFTLVSTLFETQPPTPEQIDELQALLDTLKEEQERRKTE